jgi:hypothetical protein
MTNPAPTVAGSESVSGTLTGVTGEQIKSHPNYKKYYDKAISEGASPLEANEDASMGVKDDMVKEQGKASQAKPEGKPGLPSSDTFSAKNIMSGIGDWFTGSKPNDQSVTPISPSTTPLASAKANGVYDQSAQVAAGDKQVPLTKSTNVVNAPTQVNNQTQNAMFKKPVRNEDNTLSGWLKSKFS